MLKVNDFDNLSGNEDTLNYRQLRVQSSNDNSQLVKSQETSCSEMVSCCALPLRRRLWATIFANQAAITVYDQVKRSTFPHMTS